MSNIRVMNLSSYTTPKVSESQNKEWVKYGEDDNYFQYLIDRYNGSPTNNAIINGIIELLYGKGLDAKDAAAKPEQYAQMKALFKKHCLRKLLSDLKMMGQCAIQVVWNDAHDTIVLVEHMPIETLRAEVCNEDGEVEAYYYAKDWEAVENKKETPLRIPAFRFSNESNEVLYIKPYRAGFYYYSPVDYQGGLPYAELEEEVANFHLNNIKNGMAPSMLINFNNGVPTEEDQRLLEGRIAEKFTGSSNAGRFILAFNENKELAATIDPVQLSDASAQYEFFSEECREKLMIAHRITSPMLLGIKDNSGLGNNAEELETASALFENTVIEPIQQMLLDGIEEILSENEISLKLFFKTLRPLEFDDVADMQQEQMGKEKFSAIPEVSEEMKNAIYDNLQQVGETMDEEEWELIDERPVDYNTEAIQDAMWTFASVISSKPSEASEQDTSIIKVRYKYHEMNIPRKTGQSRDFCRLMMSADKVYRKEDIQSAGAVNAGFGEGGSATYDIWLYKGGPWCRHVWFRHTYLKKNNKKISVAKARQLINQLDPSLKKEAEIKKNESEVALPPYYMPDRGYVNPPWRK
jgi:hypothetical protein